MRDFAISPPFCCLPPRRLRRPVAHHSPMRGLERPLFRCGEQAPYNFPGSWPTDITGVTARVGARYTWDARGGSVARSRPDARGGGLAPVEAHDRPLERTALDREPAEIEVAVVPPHRKQEPAEAVRHGDHRALVAAAGTERREVRGQGMGRMARVVRGLAAHGAQLGGAALGDPAGGWASRSPDWYVAGTRPA
jgi:hypothetical protein